MDKLKVEFANCWGISKLKHEFVFSTDRAKAFSVYAPNGVMKTSFAKTFEALAKGEKPKEERYGLPVFCKVEASGSPLIPEGIVVVRADAETSQNNIAISNILVKKEHREKYSLVIQNIDEIKKKLINSLQKASKVTKNNIEQQLLADCKKETFYECIKWLLSLDPIQEVNKFKYDDLFNQKAMDAINSDEFQSNAKKFIDNYNKVLDDAQDVYSKGEFNPSKAEASLESLRKYGYFKAGHHVSLKDDNALMGDEDFEAKLNKINGLINNDTELLEIKKKLAKNAQTISLIELFETLTADQVEPLLQGLSKQRQEAFRVSLWCCYVHNCTESKDFIETYEKDQAEIQEIEKEAAEVAPIWKEIITLFNNRFVDMPFIPSIDNPSEVALGKEGVKITFTFRYDDKEFKCSQESVKDTLSMGEYRSLNLLYLMFDVEERKQKGMETLFIIDDIADSFDYKNKNAILLYLRDLTETDCFYHIVLTHNFDFFRALNYSYIKPANCLIALRDEKGIALKRAQWVKNTFVAELRDKVTDDYISLYATVPFLRNIIEYTKNTKERDYIKLTSLLHWKLDTSSIMASEYLEIFNRHFNTSYKCGENNSIDNLSMVDDILFKEAEMICDEDVEELDLKKKIVLSIAIRLRAEKLMIKELSKSDSSRQFYDESFNQFDELYRELRAEFPGYAGFSVLNKIGIMVNSNIHLNSFMYEPIIDLSISSLIELYKEVKKYLP
jgi:hypothetical protein